MSILTVSIAFGYLPLSSLSAGRKKAVPTPQRKGAGSRAGRGQSTRRTPSTRGKGRRAAAKEGIKQLCSDTETVEPRFNSGLSAFLFTFATYNVHIRGWTMFC